MLQVPGTYIVIFLLTSALMGCGACSFLGLPPGQEGSRKQPILPGGLALPWGLVPDSRSQLPALTHILPGDGEAATVAFPAPPPRLSIKSNQEAFLNI